ncbi:MAG: prolyl oligopeptidase family serine peptidase [Anaerolineae bacterium]|nr:prolyl oligopeptidase family serine peptidase [Anaerolineae bacterium]
MQRHSFVLVGLLIVILMITPFAAAQEGPVQVGLRPDAPPYAVHGPYWVGVRDVVIGEGTERPLHASIWYPALNPDGLEEAITYAVAIKGNFGLPDDWRAMIAGQALLDAAPDMAAAPYPLVIYSHGFGVNSQTAAYLTEHLASYGFVVIAPDHIELYDPAEFGESAIERPMDVQQVIAFAEALAGPDGNMAGLIDTEQIGVAGHSYGGYTALAAAGGRLDTAAFTARCAEVPETSEMALFCSAVLPAWDELAALAGLDTLPEGQWPSWGDPRVRAVVSLAGSALIQADGLKEVTVPLLGMVGTLDTGGEGLASTLTVFNSASSTQKALVTFTNAEHMVFNWSCGDVPALVDIGFFGACSDAVWDMDRTHDLANHFTTAFLLNVLKGDAEAGAALAPDAVAFPGITYEAEGF